MLTRELRAYLQDLPGRCRACCAHVETQGHMPRCPRPGMKPNPERPAEPRPVLDEPAW